ncbi:MAG: threonine/serine exporter family protein [Eubacterium sp.]|nr:threonine/serine exporter family protein [Eubacterium sp.]
MKKTKAVFFTPEVERYNECLRYILDVGEMMLYSGGEINRVEDTLQRMGHAYGGEDVNVFVITTNIMMTVRFPGGVELTQTREIPNGGKLDFTRLEALNELSRQCCKQPLAPSRLRQRLDELEKIEVNPKILYLASMLSTGVFAIFFGGNIWDALVAAGFALIICFMQRKVADICPNNMIFCLLCSLVIGLGIGAIGRIVPVLHPDKIMIGDIMLLIPGLGITNAIRDVFAGDTISGMLRLVESVLWAAALAAGFMISMGLIGG